eukprot:2295367-Pleurochrysis_carterae.AAC.2
MAPGDKKSGRAEGVSPQTPLETLSVRDFGVSSPGRRRVRRSRGVIRGSGMTLRRSLRSLRAVERSRNCHGDRNRNSRLLGG